MSDVSDEGWQRLSADEFAKRLGTGDRPVPSPVQHPLETILYQSQGLGLAHNLSTQLAFIGEMDIIELQALGCHRRAGDSYEVTRAAHARAPADAIRLAVESETFITHGVYLLPAKLRSGVETRHTTPGSWYEIPSKGGTTDSDVQSRRVLAIDFDVQRPSNTSATDEEMAKSILAAVGAWEYLSGALGSTSSMAYLHSGNGRQIHLALDDLHPDETKSMLSSLLAGVASLFDTPHVRVDTKLYDAKRILPACGTVKRKGAPGIAERPHRRTAIYAPETVVRLSLEAVKDLSRKIWGDTDDKGRGAMREALGIRAPSVTPITPNPGSPFDLANAVSPEEVASWVGILDDRGRPTCPGCGETSGVAILNHGLKCHHNRCQGKGRNGFRTNVDLVAEIQRVEPIEAAKLLGKRFGFEVASSSQPSSTDLPSTPQVSFAPIVHIPAYELRTLAEILPKAVDRAERRARGVERPVPLPWKSLLPQYGGGLWPGVHYLCSGTGIGKTAAALQIALNAAMTQVPTAYVGLELEDVQIGMRLTGERARIPWSRLYTGQADRWQLDQMRASTIEMIEMDLPLHPVFAPPRGWPAKELSRLCQAMRARYPEPDGPGSRPMLLIVDFLQIIGREPNTNGRIPDLRELIGDAAYYARDVASSQNVAVLVISSVARDKYMTLSNAAQQAGITFDTDDGGRPIFRKLRNPDALVGLGKESGDIEYSGDSVSVIARAPSDNSVFWVTAKGRATGAEWTPMLFTGYRYEEPLDGGTAFASSLKSMTQKREETKQVAEKQKLDRATSDAIAVAQYLLRNPDASVRAVRFILGDAVKRWSDAQAVLGAALVKIDPQKKGMKGGLRIDMSKLPQLILQRVNENYGSQFGGGVDPNRGTDPRLPDRGSEVGVDGGLGGPPSTPTVPRSGGGVETVDRGSTLPRSHGGHRWEKDADQLEALPIRTDKAAWATEEGWDNDRIRQALAELTRRVGGFTDDEPPEDDDQ